MVIIKRTKLGTDERAAPWLKEEMVLAEPSSKKHGGYRIPYPNRPTDPWWSTYTLYWEEVSPFNIQDYYNTPIHCPTQEEADKVGIILSEHQGGWYNREWWQVCNEFTALVGNGYCDTRGVAIHTYLRTIEASYFLLHYKLTRQMDSINAGNAAGQVDFQAPLQSVSKPESITPFYIEGKPLLIKAMWQDLLEIGYTITPKVPLGGCIYICESFSIPSSLEKTKELFVTTGGLIKLEGSRRISFKLPEQYMEALAFMGERLKIAERKFAIHKELKLSLGLPKREIVISKFGVFAEDGINYDISQIKALIKMMGPLTSTLHGRELKWQKIWIGCEEGSEFTVGELEEVVTAYDNIQAGK